MEQKDTEQSYKEKMQKQVTVLLDDESDLDTLTQTLILINRIFMEFSPVKGEETTKAKEGGILLPGGLAISPEFAAMNLRDILRTTKYLRATRDAIEHCIKTFKGNKIHLVYAGCGPYGTLVLPLLSFFTPEQLKITLIDVQHESLQSVKNICENMGYMEFIDGFIQDDAALYKHPEDDPVHVVVLECMVHALGREPQVSISMNLSAQMVEDGVLVPEEICVSLIAADPEGEFKEKEKVRQHLGEVFVLDKNCKNLEIIKGEIPYIKASTITLPEDLLPLFPLMLFTRIKLFNNHLLDYYESGITHPLVIGQQDTFKPGDTMAFKYRMDSHPEFYYDKYR